MRRIEKFTICQMAVVGALFAEETSLGALATQFWRR